MHLTDMKELLQKYMDNSLTNSELTELQKSVNALSDEELEPYLQTFWQKEKGIGVSSEKIAALKKEIDELNSRKQWTRHYYMKRVTRAAAAILIPLLIVSIYLLYNEIPAKAASDMIVSVGKGERVSIVLPDGTRASLNSETTLSYNVNDFNKKARQISLNGEGYFQVAKNKDIPFVIKTSDLGVEVLGTTFNLLARNEDESIEVSLIEGKVQLTSRATSESVVLYPNHKAVLDKKTGKIDIFSTDVSLSTAWRRGELVFNSTPISKVFREIERNFGVTIRIENSRSSMDDLFTGTFSTANLNETMSILKMHYLFNYSIEGKTIRIRDFNLNNRKPD